MGIIINQSIKNTITTYLGFGIGGINTLFLYTHFLDKEHYGLVSYLLTTSNLLWPLIAFGVPNTLVKFYSSYKDSSEKNEFLNLMLLLPIGITLVLGSVGYCFYGYILTYFQGDNAIVQPYVWLIFLVALAMAYFEIFFSWAKVQLKSVFGNFMKEVFHRIAVSILLVLIYLQILTTIQFIYSLLGVYVLRLIIMKIYAFKLHYPKFEWRLPYNYIKVLKYSSLISIAGSVAVMMIDLDKFMIEKFLPISNVAVYAMYAYIASVIAVPSRAMHQITYPLTAKLLNEQNYEELHELYKDSSLNLLIISGLIFLLVVCNVRQLYELIPDTYELVILIVVLLGTTKLYDNILGNNNAILFSSDYYRIVLFLGVILAIGAIILNYVFIPKFGLTGAAFATFIAMICYNTIKLIFVYRKFGIHPFVKNTWKSLILIIVITVGCLFWDFSFHPLLNIAMKSALISLFYVAIVYSLKLSEAINALVNQKIKTK